MPLPFIAGLALGSIVVLGFTKRKAIKEELNSGAKYVKELAKKKGRQAKAKYEELKDEVKRRTEEGGGRAEKVTKTPDEKKSRKPRKPRTKRAEKSIEQTIEQSTMQSNEALS